MIEELHIRDLGVIEDATLNLAPGLTVVTGETGAGKTMLVTALQLLVGARADTSLVRTGSDMATVDMVLCPPPEEAEPWMDERAVIVSREIPADGRSRARLGGRPVPVSTLAEVLGPSIEVHAQHEHVRLSRPAVQRDLLDRFAGEAHARNFAVYREAYTRWQEVRQRRDHLVAAARERARELDHITHELDEIEAAELDLEADGAIDAVIERLANADELHLGATQAAAALGSEGAGEPVGVALNALRRLDVDDDHLEELLSRLTGVSAELADLAADIRAYAEGVYADPDRLAELQERKRQITALNRKYGASLTDVLAHAETVRRRIAEIEAEDADATAIEERLEGARGDLDTAADAVRRGRRTAGRQLATVVDAHLSELGMPHARMQVTVEAKAPAADGADEVTLLLAPNPGEPAKPIADAVSGGERSRTSLAIEVALADVDDARVLVFDEVDAGIGGVTAMAVGEKLARLAAGDGAHPRQVLCVTHLAQLAAFADVHHVVEKGLADGRTVTTARRVHADDRIAELSRMLGGTVHGAGLDHARELIADAATRRVG